MREYKKISSELYDFTKPIGKSLDGDLEFYYQEIKDFKGPILEAGVGTGRLLIPYLERGLKIEGLDYSQEMLDLCKKNLDQRGLKTRLYRQDLKTMSLDKKFEAIIMPTGSICLIDNIDLLLKNFYDHLRDQGKIFIDLIFPLDFKPGCQSQIYRLSPSESIVYTSNNEKIDFLEQKTYCLNRYEKWVDDKLVDTELAEFNLNWYGIREFSLLLEKHGFTNIEYIRGYGGQADYLVTFRAQKNNE